MSIHVISLHAQDRKYFPILNEITGAMAVLFWHNRDGTAALSVYSSYAADAPWACCESDHMWMHSSIWFQVCTPALMTQWRTAPTRYGRPKSTA